MDPGVSGAACDGTPPGNENWRNRWRMPARSGVAAENSSEYVPSRYAFATMPGPPWPGPAM